MKGLYLFVLLATLGLVLIACNPDPDSTAGGKDEEKKESTGEPQQGGDLVLASTGSPTMFNPLYTSDTTSGVVEDMIYNGLTETAPDGEMIPDLASEWEYNEDETVLTFTLRDDVTWHDGARVTTKRVELK